MDVELIRLIQEQEIDERTYRILPERISDNSFVFLASNQFLDMNDRDEKGRILDTYHGWVKEDVV